jgi:hypothetical protein
MWLLDAIMERLPFSNRPDVRQRVDQLFSREMLGAVLVGKFVGDYAAIKTTSLFGVDGGYILGIVTTVTLFVYWERVAQRAKEESQKLNTAQTQITDDWK